MKMKKKLLLVAAVLVVAFLSMAGSCQIPGTDWYCYIGKGSFNCSLD